jgi:glycosyltransferase involved in cell wall biosynthesis
VKVPLLSIIIPAYNAASSIRTIATAILSEKFTDFELIVVDDGSKDDTLRVVRGLASKDKRVIVRAQRNGGPSSARNTGLQKARGTYIQFYDADDTIVPGSLQKIIDAAERSHSDIVVSGWRVNLQTKHGIIQAYKEISPEGGEVEGSKILPYVVRSIGTDGRLYNLWNKLFRADIIREHDLTFREDIRFGEDIIFTLHYLRFARKISFIPDLTYNYLSGGVSSVFSGSSIVPDYRIVNDQELTSFAGAERGPELDDLYHWVRWRWLFSYWSMVAKANIPREEKLRLIRAIPLDPYVAARSDQYIGKRNYRIEKTLKALLTSPAAALAFAQLVVRMRSGIVSAKLLKRRGAIINPNEKD